MLVPLAPSAASIARSRLRLRVRRLGRSVARERLGEERIAQRLALLDADEAELDEPLHRRARAAELLLEARERDRAVRADEREDARRAAP